MNDAPPEPVESMVHLTGISGSAGFAVGRAFVVEGDYLGATHRRIRPEDCQAELARFDQSVAGSIQELRQVTEDLKGGNTPVASEASILDAYILMLGDVTLRHQVQTLIEGSLQCAEWALESSVGEMCRKLRDSGDAYLAERSHDFEFIRDRILRGLAGRKEAQIMPESGEPVIIVAHDLSPSQTATLTKDRVLALVTAVGTRTSHTAILARALDIPAVVGVRFLLSEVGEGDMLVVDGLHGEIVVSPSQEVVEAFRPKAERYYAQARGLRAHHEDPAQTSDGVGVTLQANIELPLEADSVTEYGARGIGLYRTEFLYIDRPTPPSEEEQYEAYRRVVQAVHPFSVTLRTFDIGGDKFFSAVPLPSEPNPALGLRAVRLGLAQPVMLKTQLRAMVRASCHGTVKILIPMVASLSELRAVRALLSEAVLEVDRGGHPHANHIDLGCMVEVPSAAIMAEEFAREADFLSIGTNDLVQYTLAVDRTSQELARLACYFDPSIIRLLKGVVQAATFRQKELSVCGTMASDPLAAILLVGMGFRSLSMEASAIPEVKAALSRVSLREAVDAAGSAFEATTAQELEQKLSERFQGLLQDILDPG